MKGMTTATDGPTAARPQAHDPLHLASMRLFSHVDELSMTTVHFVSRHGRACLVLVLGMVGCSTALRAPAPAHQTPPESSDRNYARIEAELFDAINRARTDPQRTAADLDALTKYYRGKLFQRPEQPVPIQTIEGVSAVREAAAAVRSERPLDSLTWSTELTRAARDHAEDQRYTGSIGHTGSDGSSVDTRARRYGTWLTSISENIDYSPAVRGGDVVQNLLVDDGVPDRGHRRNIYEPTAKVIGIACGPHPRYGVMCVIVQAGGFIAK